MMIEEYSWQAIIGPVEDELFHLSEAPTDPLSLLLAKEDEILVPRSKIPQACDLIKTVFYIAKDRDAVIKVDCFPLLEEFMVSIDRNSSFTILVEDYKLKIKSGSLKEVLISIAKALWSYGYSKEEVNAFLTSIKVDLNDFWEGGI